MNVQQKKHVMRRGMRKPRGLKVRNYADFLIDIIEYLTVLPGGKAIDKICEMELDDFFYKYVA